jgi:cell division protein FtsB
MEWLAILEAAMNALTALQAVDGGVAAVVTQVNQTIAAAKADGNRAPTQAERDALDAVINAQMAKLDAAAGG